MGVPPTPPVPDSMSRSRLYAGCGGLARSQYADKKIPKAISQIFNCTSQAHMLKYYIQGEPYVKMHTMRSAKPGKTRQSR